MTRDNVLFKNPYLLGVLGGPFQDFRLAPPAFSIWEYPPGDFYSFLKLRIYITNRLCFLAGHSPSQKHFIFSGRSDVLKTQLKCSPTSKSEDVTWTSPRSALVLATERNNWVSLDVPRNFRFLIFDFLDAEMFRSGINAKFQIQSLSFLFCIASCRIPLQVMW